MGTGPSGRAVAVSGLIAITAVFALGAVAWDSAPNSTRAGSVRGSILAASDRGIFRRHPDGKLTQLTTNVNDQFPAWSRDGKQIAFVRFVQYPADRRELACRLFVINGDGTGLHQVGQVKTDCSGASWGPGDRQLAFGGGQPGANGASLWVVNVNGTGARRLFRGHGANLEGAHPAWSPDGRTIVFSWTASQLNGLLAVRPDGSRLHALVKPRPGHTERFAQPMWSRDGKRLAFVHVDFNTQATTIVTATAHGGRRHTLARLPLNPGQMGVPSWSPNGSLIAFSGLCGRQGCVWTIPSRGGTRRVLLRGHFLQGTWGPAGT